MATNPTASTFQMRPASIQEVVTRCDQGEEFSFLLSSFLDTFYNHIKHNEISAAYSALAREPPLGPNPQRNAYVGAVAEYLARRWGLPSVPAWTERPERFLQRPLFDQAAPSARALYLVESPAAFRRRLIFVEASPLRRASMPVSR